MTCWAPLLARLLAVSALLGGCGGSDHEPPSADRPDTALAPGDPGAPLQTGNTAEDGFNWFNFRRSQAGLPLLARNELLDAAARGHSEYQQRNNVITHEQQPSAPGYTGTTPGERLAAAGYRFSERSYAYGEVIAAAGTPSGVVAAEALITAIYHRFVIFEPMFREAGSGASRNAQGTTWLTTNFAADGLRPALGQGNFVTWPAAGQQRVPVLFLTNSEIPDPLPQQNAAGYPVSIHADITSLIEVDSFTLRERGGPLLPVRLLSAGTDRYTPAAAAAVIPLQVLRRETVHEAEFRGSIDGMPVTHAWSFTTR